MRRVTNRLLQCTSRHAQVRLVATATKRKAWQDSEEPDLLPPAPNLSKWARPEPLYVPRAHKEGVHESPPAQDSRACLESGDPEIPPRPDLGKWARPRPIRTHTPSASKPPDLQHCAVRLDSGEPEPPPTPSYNKWARPEPIYAPTAHTESALKTPVPQYSRATREREVPPLSNRAPELHAESRLKPSASQHLGEPDVPALAPNIKKWARPEPMYTYTETPVKQPALADSVAPLDSREPLFPPNLRKWAPLAPSSTPEMHTESTVHPPTPLGLRYPELPLAPNLSKWAPPGPSPTSEVCTEGAPKSLTPQYFDRTTQSQRAFTSSSSRTPPPHDDAPSLSRTVPSHADAASVPPHTLKAHTESVPELPPSQGAAALVGPGKTGPPPPAPNLGKWARPEPVSTLKLPTESALQDSDHSTQSQSAIASGSSRTPRSSQQTRLSGTPSHCNAPSLSRAVPPHTDAASLPSHAASQQTQRGFQTSRAASQPSLDSAHTPSPDPPPLLLRERYSRWATKISPGPSTLIPSASQIDVMKSSMAKWQMPPVISRGRDSLSSHHHTPPDELGSITWSGNRLSSEAPLASTSRQDTTRFNQGPHVEHSDRKAASGQSGSGLVPGPRTVQDGRTEDAQQLGTSWRQRKRKDTQFSLPKVSHSAKEADPRRLRRGEFKSRGSLVESVVARADEEVAIQTHQTRNAASQSRVKPILKVKRKAKVIKKVVDVYIPTVVPVGQLAKLLNVRLETLQQTMREAGMESESSYDYVLTAEYATLLAEEFGRNPIVSDEASFDLYPSPPHPNPSTLPTRPPIITIMGHVDHGKTTLLDALRSTSVAKGEAGGITQHIGAFSVPVSTGGAGGARKTITFLDTPGHAAFSAMRARGARVTDVVVLVVAADDGVMPQTKEVIELVKKDSATVVVAINKIDKPGVDVERVHMSLMAEGIQVEAVGGDVPAVQVSGLTGQGLQELVETLSVVADVQDLRSEKTGNAHGYVIESNFHKGLGPVATVLILRGCLKPGSHILAGTAHAKVRLMTDPNGASVKAAYPGMAVTVSGWKELPGAGDEVLQGTEANVKRALGNRVRKLEIEEELRDAEAINVRRQQEREERLREMSEPGSSGDVAVEDAAQGVEDERKELRLVVKADVSGSVEAVVGAMEGVRSKKATVKVISTGVGPVTESDVMMAKAVDGMVVAFSVDAPRAVETIAAQNHVLVYSSSIIYRIMDEIKARLIALLPVIVEKKVTGEATVLQLFDIHLKGKKIKKIAGCRIANGLAEKAKGARIVRAGEIVHEGKLDTLRHLKKDITEARKGLECGMSFESFDDMQEGDLIQFFEVLERPSTL